MPGLKTIIPGGSAPGQLERVLVLVEFRLTYQKAVAEQVLALPTEASLVGPTRQVTVRLVRPVSAKAVELTQRLLGFPLVRSPSSFLSLPPTSLTTTLPLPTNPIASPLSPCMRNPITQSKTNASQATLLRC